MKEKLIALLMVSVMVASAFGALSISATKVGAAGETLTLQSTNYTLFAGLPYTISGYLRDSAGPLANKPVDIFYQFQGGARQFSNTIYTGSDGKYSTTISSSKLVYLQTGYKVGSVYVASSNVVKIDVQRVPTTLTLSSTNYAPTPGQQYTISGYLRDSAGNPLANKPIVIWYHFLDDEYRHVSNTVYTGADGKYSTTVTSSQPVVLQTTFDGDRSYFNGNSFSVAIYVEKHYTTLTLYTSNANPTPGQQYTLSGILTDSAGNGLANKPIGIHYAFPGGYFQFSNTVYTGADGKYSTTISSSKTIYLKTMFQGDSGYGGADSYFLFINVTP